MNPWKFDITLAIPDGSRILMLADGTLPVFRSETMFSHLHLLQREVHKTLNADITLLRLVAELPNRETRIVRAVWLVENRTPDWTPPAGSTWITDSTSITDEWLQGAVDKALELLQDTAPLPPWFYAGWFAEARQWTTHTLTELGYTLTAPPEQFKQFGISALLRTETTDGAVYFKVPNSKPLFCNEPSVTQTLSTLFPQNIPTPIAIDPERRWMLTKDMGNTLRDNGAPSPETLKRVIQEYAQFQIQSIQHIDTLLDAGCLDRRLNVLANQLDDVSTEADWLAAIPKIKALCHELAGFNIPHTLVHGDFHAANIIIQDESVIYFDWTDACIAHPFLDPLPLIDFDAQDHAEMIRDAYLACWTDFAPMPELRRAYDIATILAAAHQIVSYHHIHAAMPPHEQGNWEWAVPHFMKTIFKEL
mgnify:CR=1 FL=1